MVNVSYYCYFHEFLMVMSIQFCLLPFDVDLLVHPGSRSQAALVAEQAKASGICLIAFDRPGFGQSTRQPA